MTLRFATGVPLKLTSSVVGTSIQLLTLTSQAVRHWQLPSMRVSLKLSSTTKWLEIQPDVDKFVDNSLLASLANLRLGTLRLRELTTANLGSRQPDWWLATNMKTIKKYTSSTKDLKSLAGNPIMATIQAY